MSLPVRVIDTGLRDGRRNIAFDAALIELHREGAIPDSMRFLRFRPVALLGRHQALSHEIKPAYCREHGIGIGRRVTGGGAIYFDEGQLGWELVVSRTRLPLGTLADFTRAICEAAAHGLATGFGIDARYRPRNDIEVGGRKISGTGGFFDGDTLFYQGTVLIDADLARMMACLNVPAEKLAKRDLDRPEARVTTLKDVLGRVPDVAEVQAALIAGFRERLGFIPERGAILAVEEERARTLHDEEIGTETFVHEIDDPAGADVLSASRTGAGGTVSAFVRLDGPRGARRLREVLLTGDFFVTPPRMVFDLEASLRGVPVGEVALAVDRFFAVARPDLLSLRSDDFREVVAAAIANERAEAS